MQPMRPAWSSQFIQENLSVIDLPLAITRMNCEEVYRNGSGKGVKVAIIDSGVDASHPALQEGGVNGYVSVVVNGDGDTVQYDTEPHEDSCGHGTACAGIIRSLAPQCEVYSVKVLGKGLMGRGSTFIAGLRWALENNMHVCNLSLGTTKKEFSAALHDVADMAYFRRIVLVTAANNMPIPSFPSMYSSVISVAAHHEQDPMRFYYNPRPPVEFGALGIDVRVPWLQQKWTTVTGNSFAAPHITGIVAKILGEYPMLTPFQVKTVLMTLAKNTSQLEV